MKFYSKFKNLQVALINNSIIEFKDGVADVEDRASIKELKGLKMFGRALWCDEDKK